MLSSSMINGGFEGSFFSSCASACLQLLTANHTHARVTSEVIRGLQGDRWLQASFQVSVPQWAVRLSATRIPRCCWEDMSQPCSSQRHFLTAGRDQHKCADSLLTLNPSAFTNSKWELQKIVSTWEHFRVSNQFNVYVFAQQEEAAATSSQLSCIHVKYARMKSAKKIASTF